MHAKSHVNKWACQQNTMFTEKNNIMYERFHTCAEYYFSAKTKNMFIYSSWQMKNAGSMAFFLWT